MADRINFTNKINDSAQVGDILYYIYSTETEPSEVGSIIEVGEKHIKVETPNDLPDMTDFTLAYNLVTNGTFDISATGWSSLNAETTSTWVSSGEIQVVASGDNGGIQQEVTGLTIGEEYTFSYEVISGSGNFAHLFPGPFATNIGLNQGVGIYNHTFEATTTSVTIRLGVLDGNTVNFDNISLLPPATLPFFMFKKTNNTVSYAKSGIKGSYASVKIFTSNPTVKTKMFALGAEIAESSK
tara:strand:+ start:1558 stop:2280 length:723 start_codon:yes stop_codon:yes gene_type:complete